MRRLSAGRLLHSLFLLYFSQPAADRAVYRAMRGRPIRSVVELGINQTERTRRVLEVARWRKENAPLRYAGIDLFEARTGAQSGLTLKQVFAALKRPDVQVQLVPGDTANALRRVANSLANTDLLLIAAHHDRESLEQAWAWIPRMLCPTSLVFREEPAQSPGRMIWRPLQLTDIERMAAEACKMRRAA
jgi:hypothetical protein